MKMAFAVGWMALLSMLVPSFARGDVHGGTWAAKATLNAASYTQIYGIANVAQNTNYTGSFWIKGSGTMHLIVNNPAWTYFPVTVSVTATSTWTQVTLPTFSSSTNTQLVFRFYDDVGSAPGSIMYIDDGFLGLSGGSNLLGNPGFESGASGWNVGAAFSVGQFGSAAPPAPTGLTATGGNAQVSLSWAASAGATSYSVFRGTTSNGESATALATGITATGTTDFTVTNGTTYFYKVQAVNASGSSGNSNEASATPSAGGILVNGTYTLAPANATGTRLDVQGAGTADGTNVQAATSNGGTNQQWILTNVSGNVYRLSPAHASAQCLDVAGQATASGTNVQTWTYLAQQNQKWALTAVSGGYTLTPQHATGLRLNNTGTASGSNVNVTTANGSTAQTWAIVAVGGGGSVPAVPTGLSAFPASTQVSLFWNAASGATSYSVFRGTAANAESTTAIVTGVTSTNYTNTGLTNGTTYFYKVKAVNTTGSSAYSNEASATPAAGSSETIGGGTLSSPAQGPAASFGLGTGFTLVKNWNFGTTGTITNMAQLDANFNYHDQFNQWTFGGGNYGAMCVASSSATALSGQPVVGINSPEVRQFTSDAMRTLLTGLNGATTVNVSSHNAGSGSVVAKWKLPAGGSRLNQDILWEVRSKMVVPKWYWWAIWTSGNEWSGGAEMDVVEGFGYDNGGGNTNFDGRFWHVNSVGGSDADAYSSWGNSMSAHGVNNWDASIYHTWTWIYRKNNTYTVYMDGIQVQNGTLIWTDGATSGGPAIDMDFELDGAWGHDGIPSVRGSMPVTEFNGKFYDWDYSRVYLKP